MACSMEYIEYVCSQIENVGVVRYRKMMGDYVVYVDEKCVILACDEICYVKKIAEIEGLMADAETGFPYEGAKEHYILDIDHRSLAEKVVGVLRDVLPFPKSRKRKSDVKKRNERKG